MKLTWLCASLASSCLISFSFAYDAYSLSVLQQRTGHDAYANATCPPCPTCEVGTGEVKDEEKADPITVQILLFDSQGIVDMVAWNARDYEEFTGGKVKIEIKKTPTLNQLYEEIESDARSHGGLFDAYYTNPIVMGTAAMLGGFLDLTPYVKENPLSDWTDVLLALRNYVTSFEDKIYMILLDGDTHTMFYRKDVLDHFGLQAPRTWNEYIEVASKVHGQTFLNRTLSGSCVSRVPGDHATYWSHLVLSTITQTHGTSTGSMFDTKDMTPLAGNAVAEMLRIHEEQAKYGTPDEFDELVNAVMNQQMNDGNCVLTYMWGDMFRRSKAEGSVLHDKLGIAPTPGSEWVLNRKTGELERCNSDNCPYAKFYEDIGWVNSAPYAANGGWCGAISANTTPEKQKVLVEFFIWASSREQSEKYVIPNATLPIDKINGQDPWRKDHLDVDKWAAKGFDRELSKQYVDAILHNLVSKNVVVENRWPMAGEVMSILDTEVNDYLVRAVVRKEIPEENKETERLRVAERLSRQWKNVIKTYNERGDTEAPILDIYQRLRGVYVPNEEKNQLTKVRFIGYTFFVVILVFSIGSMIWVYSNQKKNPVLKASQPPFLYLLAFGTLTMGSSIITLGTDDSIATIEACSKACLAGPWLFAIGFTIAFAALFSKIWRLNRLVKSAKVFQRIQVTATDVLGPFVVMIVLNFAFLSTMTILDPLYWERIYTGRNGDGELTSYGSCHAEGIIFATMMGLIAAVNIIGIIFACVQAYQTRKIHIAYNESHYIGLCLASMLQATLIGLPLMFLANDNPIATYVVRSSLVFIICIALLGFIFIPKFLTDPAKSTRSFIVVGLNPLENSYNSRSRGSRIIQKTGLHNASRSAMFSEHVSRPFQNEPENVPKQIEKEPEKSVHFEMASEQSSESHLFHGVTTLNLSTTIGHTDSVHTI